MKVLLMAFECSPYRGSEWAVGWGRLLQAARIAETHVVTSAENFAALDRAHSEGLIPTNVRFYTPTPDAHLLAHDPHAGMFAYDYAAYHHWQKLALPLIKDLHARERFDLVHQVTVNTFREPSYAYELGIPFLWGPVGGSQNFPVKFLSILPKKEAAKELVRAFANKLTLRFNSRVRTAARKATYILASNSTNQRDYSKAWGRAVDRLLETGLHEIPAPDRSRFFERIAIKQRGEPLPPLQILWSGELQTRKALPILLRALARLEITPFELTVLGDGPMRSLWEAEAASLGLADRVHFRGRLSFPEAVAAMHSAHLFCFTSLRDTSGNVILEALAAGVPVVCFDHQGAADMIDDVSGIKVPVTNPADAIRDFRHAISVLAALPERLSVLSAGAHLSAARFLWNTNGDYINRIYQELAQPKMRP